jgi:hypothetical protein
MYDFFAEASLIEKMVMISIVLVFVCFIASGLTGGMRSNAEWYAQRWAERLNVRIEAISCQSWDTDMDGYVSCSIKIDGQINNMECGFGGCRQPKTSILVGGR